MKKTIILLLIISLCYTACTDLDLNPLDQGSTESWYITETQFDMAVNNLYVIDYWPVASLSWSDDYTYRNAMSAIVSGTLNSEDDDVEAWYANQYKGIALANTIINSLDKGRENGIAESTLLQYEAEARFCRANRYAQLVFAFGDVVYLTEVVDLEVAYTLGRTDKETVIQAIYDDFDFAVENLPESYSSQLRATRGAAMALKARYALYFGDYAIARQAALDCMDLEIYSLAPDFATYFLTKNDAAESIFLIPRSIVNDIYFSTKDYIPRNLGGYAGWDPSWDLLASFECTDGLPIDESPLFNPGDPFADRDPRCTATIVEFGTVHMGVTYQPHPDTLKVWNYNTGKSVSNKDNRAVAQYASYNGLVWRKGIDATWGSDYSYKADPDRVIIRYADVLLIYAEANIELNTIDQTVLDAINTVRSRAYGVDITDTDNYPEITTTDQSELRKIVRRERRVEFAREGLRYFDIIRWKTAGKVLSAPNCGMLYPAATLRSVIVEAGLWFWPSTPPIDDDGMADFSDMVNNGYAQVLSQGNWDDRQYLWPIPAVEIVINDNIIQNYGY